MAQPLGRFPNADASDRGNLTVESHVGTSQLTSHQSLSTDWTGAEVVLRPTYWIIDRATITRQVGNTVILNNPSTYPLTDGWGYFIQNHPATLDQPGEWYYNSANQTLQFYNNQPNATGSTITATVTDRVVDIADANFISIQNLHIAQARETNLYGLNVSNLTLINDDFTDSGEDGVLIQGSGKDILIANCRITNSNNNGFFIGPYQNVTFRQNIIRNSGVLPGRGKRGDGQFTAFQSFATRNTLIENNVIDSVGYIGVSVQNNTIVRQNVIANFCMTKSDGGGLYLWNGTQSSMSNITVQANIIRKGIGTPGGVADTTVSGAHGIFLDDCVENVTITDNTIADCQGLGIYMHAVSNVNILRNTCFNNSVGQLVLYRYDNPCIPRNNTLKQNVLVAKTATQSVVGYISSANDLASFGSMEQNYYVRPFNDLSTIRAVYNTNIVNDLNLSQWQTQFGLDVTSKPSPITYKSYTVTSLSSTNRINDSFTSNIEGWGVWSPYANGRTTWSASSLLDKGSLQINVSELSDKPDSYLLVYRSIQKVVKAKSYLLRLDAVAVTDQKITVFIRQRQAPFQDVSRRFEFMVGPSRKKYEFAFTALADEGDALLTFQLHQNSQPIWLDNVSLQEANVVPANPDTFIRLVYNPTRSDSTILLDKPYRDVRNHYYAHQVSLKSFSSIVLLRDSLPPVDIRLSLKANRTSVKIGEVTSFSLSLHNETGDQNAGWVQWSCRLPASLTLVDSNGLSYKDSMLTGTVTRLLTDTTFVFQLKATKAGRYALASEVTATTYADPDSTPGSGADDGEDDRAVVTLLIHEGTSTDTVGIVTAVDPVNSLIKKNAIFPNPSADTFTFVAEADIATIRVLDLFGRVHLTLEAARKGQSIHFGQQLPSTHYLLQVQYKTGEQRVAKLLKL